MHPMFAVHKKGWVTTYIVTRSNIDSKSLS